MNISMRTLSARTMILGLVCALWGIPQASARARHMNALDEHHDPRALPRSVGNPTGIGAEGKPLVPETSAATCPARGESRSPRKHQRPRARRGGEAVRPGSIGGHVFGADGKPLVLAGVRLMGTQRGAHTDSLGAFTLKRLRPGTYSLLISYVGYHPDTVAVTVRARSVTNLTATLVVRPMLLDTIIVRTIRVHPDVEKTGTNSLSIHGRRRAIETTIRVDGVEVPDPYCDGYGNGASGQYPTVASFAGEEMQVMTIGYGNTALPVGPFAVDEVNTRGFSAEYGNILNGVVNTQDGATQK